MVTKTFIKELALGAKKSASAVGGIALAALLALALSLFTNEAHSQTDNSISSLRGAVVVPGMKEMVIIVDTTGGNTPNLAATYPILKAHGLIEKSHFLLQVERNDPDSSVAFTYDNRNYFIRPARITYPFGDKK